MTDASMSESQIGQLNVSTITAKAFRSSGASIAVRSLRDEKSLQTAPKNAPDTSNTLRDTCCY